MGQAAPFVPAPLDPDQRQRVIDALGRLTARLDPKRLLDFIEGDLSLYADLTFLEQIAIGRFLREHRDIVDRLVLEHMLDLIEEGRPDLYPLVEHPLGRVWLQRQVQELRAIIRS